MLEGRNIVVGVCGGIAAYKVVEVVSRLKKLNAEIDVIMTENAAKFVAPLTFQSISHNPVVAGMFDEPKQWSIQHISLAEKADMILVAPATANIIGKVANGIADDMLTTTIMAARSKVVFVPAMNTAMYENGIVQDNIAKLKRKGYIFLEPGEGLMACGTTGKGRLPEPADIVGNVVSIFTGAHSDMKGIKVLVTAGPTRESIDPVRFISNHSSGKMGYAIAGAAAERGAEVRLVSGPVKIPPPQNVDVIAAVTADDMYRRALEYYDKSDIIIFTAAVADYRPEYTSDKKIKKEQETLTIRLVKNPDIAKELGKIKGEKIHIGFSAETDNLVQNAEAKLKAKNFDMIIANDVTMEGAGFGVDTNIVKIIYKDGSIRELPLMSKKDLAVEILDEALKIMERGRGAL